MRLIDQMLLEITEKNLLGDIMTISISKDGIDELLVDYRQEFEYEIMEMGRDVNIKDVEEYFGMPIVINNFMNGNKKYSLLKEAE